MFVFAAIPRLIYLLIVAPSFDDWNWTLATDVLRHGSLSVNGVKTTDFDPLYPVFLAAVRWAVGDRLLVAQAVQALVAAFGGVCLFHLAEALTRRRRVAILAAALYALYPLLWRHSADGTDAALLTTLLIAFASSFVSARTPAGAAVAGVWLGLAILTRAALLPLMPAAAVVMFTSGRRRAAVGLMAAVVVILPFALRNHALNGSLLPTRSGINLFVSNSEYVTLPDYSPDLLEDYAATIVTCEGLDRLPPSPARDRMKNELFTRLAMAEMTRQPLRTLRLATMNLLYFFSPRLIPYRERTDETRIVLNPDRTFSVEHSAARPLLHHLAYSIPYGLLMAMMAAAFYLRAADVRRDAILWCIVVTFAVVHMVCFPLSVSRADGVRAAVLRRRRSRCVGAPVHGVWNSGACLICARPESISWSARPSSRPGRPDLRSLAVFVGRIKRSETANQQRAHVGAAAGGSQQAPRLGRPRSGRSPRAVRSILPSRLLVLLTRGTSSLVMKSWRY